MLVSVGSASNVDDTDTHPNEFHRANVLEFSPDGKFVKVYASGIRNCVGEAINPTTGQLWCSTNERDRLGNNLVPDYITSVKEDGFYGWPWYYMGGHQDPRHAGKHPELKDKVIVPDVLLQPHFASLEMAFYEGKQFPSQYTGDAFAAEHGSWNRSKRSGYQVIRVPMRNGHATGEYEDFLTGFVTPDGKVWGRPVGVTSGQRRLALRHRRRHKERLARHLHRQVIHAQTTTRPRSSAASGSCIAGYRSTHGTYSMQQPQPQASAPRRICRVTLVQSQPLRAQTHSQHIQAIAIELAAEPASS